MQIFISTRIISLTQMLFRASESSNLIWSEVQRPRSLLSVLHFLLPLWLSSKWGSTWQSAKHVGHCFKITIQKNLTKINKKLTYKLTLKRQRFWKWRGKDGELRDARILVSFRILLLLPLLDFYCSAWKFILETFIMREQLFQFLLKFFD